MRCLNLLDNFSGKHQVEGSASNAVIANGTDCDDLTWGTISKVTFGRGLADFSC
jgi:hypothetical protein